MEKKIRTNLKGEGSPGWSACPLVRGGHIHGKAAFLPCQMPGGPTDLLAAVKMGKMHRKSPAALGR